MTAAKRVCFGIPTVFSFSSKTCSVCSDFGACRRLAHDALIEAPATAEITHALVEFEREVVASVPVPKAKTEVAPVAPASAGTHYTRRGNRHLELTDDQKNIVRSIPMKAGDMLEKIFRRGHDAEIRIALKRGETPLTDVKGYRSLKLALSKLSKGIDRQGLRACFEQELGWGYSSAWNEVSLLWTVLPAMGVAVERAGKMVVAPSVLAKN